MRSTIIILAIALFWSCKEKENKQEDVISDDLETIDNTESKIIFKSKKDSVMDYNTTTRHVHAAKTQYYRWYQLYEGEITPRRIENQMDILADDVQITSVAGTLSGKLGYPERVQAYKGWQNAHHVQRVDVKSYPDKTLKIDAEIIYQNIRTNGNKNQVRIAYEVYTTAYDSKELPQLSVVNIKPVEELEVTDFKDAYSTNRVLALMHYWLFNVEKMDGNSEPFKKVLAENFQLNFSQNRQIKNLEEFNTWLKGVSSQASATNHFPENITISELSNNNYKLEVDFIWRGKTADGIAMKAHTQHTWLIEDDINEPFARIKQMDVAYKMPFTPIED